MANPAVSPSLSTVTVVEPPDLFANGVATATITVTVRDVNGALVGLGSAGQNASAKVTVIVDGARTELAYPNGQQASALGVVTATLTSTRSGTKTVRVRVRHDDGQIGISDRPVAGVDQTAAGVNVGLRDATALSAEKAGGTLVAPVGLSGGTGWSVTAPDTLTFADGGVLDLYGDGGSITNTLFTNPANNGTFTIDTVDSDTQVTTVEQTLLTEGADVDALVQPDAWVGMDYNTTVTVNAANVRFENCRFTAAASDVYAVVCDNQANVSFTDCEFIGGRLGCIQGRGYTALRCWVHNVQGNGLVLTVGNERIQFIQGLIENFGTGQAFPGIGVLAAPGCPIRLGGTRIEANATLGSSCIRATSVTGQPAPNQLTCESVWFNGGDPVVRFEQSAGAPVPTICQLQNARFGRSYGSQGLLRSDDDDADEVLEAGSLKRWCIWDDTLDTITLADVPLFAGDGRWVNENWDAQRDGHFRYPFPTYDLDDTPVVTFLGTAPTTVARQINVARTAAGGLENG